MDLKPTRSTELLNITIVGKGLRLPLVHYCAVYISKQTQIISIYEVWGSTFTFANVSCTAIIIVL